MINYSGWMEKVSDEQTVRNAIHAFNHHSVEALRAGSHRPHRVRTALGGIDADTFKALLHRPPCDFGKETSLWTLDLVAAVCFELRILPFFLPTKSPWLNLIEPKWVHGKRAVVEPNEVLSAPQLAERVCAYFRCPHETHLSLSAA